MEERSTKEFKATASLRMGNLTHEQVAVFRACCDKWSEADHRRWNKWSSETEATVKAVIDDQGETP